MLAALADYLNANDGETVELILEQKGRSVVLSEAANA